MHLKLMTTWYCKDCFNWKRMRLWFTISIDTEKILMPLDVLHKISVIVLRMMKNSPKPCKCMRGWRRRIYVWKCKIWSPCSVQRHKIPKPMTWVETRSKRTHTIKLVQIHQKLDLNKDRVEVLKTKLSWKKRFSENQRLTGMLELSIDHISW